MPPRIRFRDLARACITCIVCPIEDVSGEIFNVGSNNQNFTKLELAKTVQEFFPDIEIEIQEFKKDPRNYRVSFDKIQEKLDFKTKHTIRDGISDMINAINNGEMYQKSDFQTRAKLAEKIQ